MVMQQHYYTDDFKAKVILAAFNGQQTVREIAATLN